MFHNDNSGSIADFEQDNVSWDKVKTEKLDRHMPYWVNTHFVY